MRSIVATAAHPHPGHAKRRVSRLPPEGGGRYSLILAAFLLASAAPPPAVDGARLLDDIPAPTLAAYRLFIDRHGRVPAPGVEPYTLNTPLFSDYAEKYRFAWMPPGTSARYTADGGLDFPVGTTLVKSFGFPADFRAP